MLCEPLNAEKMQELFFMAVLTFLNVDIQRILIINIMRSLPEVLYGLDEEL